MDETGIRISASPISNPSMGRGCKRLRSGLMSLPTFCGKALALRQKIGRGDSNTVAFTVRGFESRLFQKPNGRIP